MRLRAAGKHPISGEPEMGLMVGLKAEAQTKLNLTRKIRRVKG